MAGKLCITEPVRCRQCERREIRHLYWNPLVLTNFFYRIGPVVGRNWLGVEPGACADFELRGRVSGISAAVLVVVLAHLVTLGQLAVDTAVDPMLDLITKLPVERLDVG
jgi:hypothetical protein